MVVAAFPAGWDNLASTILATHSKETLTVEKITPIIKEEHKHHQLMMKSSSGGHHVNYVNKSSSIKTESHILQNGNQIKVPALHLNRPMLKLINLTNMGLIGKEIRTLENVEKSLNVLKRKGDLSQLLRIKAKERQSTLFRDNSLKNQMVKDNSFIILICCLMKVLTIQNQN
ncbi:hypothetical protein AMATHDRAFT_9213 [Amanita thiersii Skay4041]|uniref:Uncharacterized protein n=1 Tax=Amanita thiersii Skay4041 TaxID=703135 RepID=A0A2A9N7I6_9AGAR|nr:hypothetical protein AMATHDRAFT_9213 [Amanita thiersii Skay4041]